jgi:hypothetical protein
MLRHACGYALANKGHDTRAIQGSSVTARSRARRSTRPWRRTGSRISGESERAAGKGLRHHNRHRPGERLPGVGSGQLIDALTPNRFKDFRAQHLVLW